MANSLIPYTSAEQVQSAVKTWLATCPALPSGVDFSFEDLPDNNVGICIASNQSAFYSRRYICGGYEAQYRFSIIYRVLPTDDADSLTAVNTLNQIAAWCEQAATKPVITSATVKQIERTSDVGVLAAYEDGTRDFSISLLLTWEVL